MYNCTRLYYSIHSTYVLSTLSTTTMYSVVLLLEYQYYAVRTVDSFADAFASMRFLGGRIFPHLESRGGVSVIGEDERTQKYILQPDPK